MDNTNLSDTYKTEGVQLSRSLMQKGIILTTDSLSNNLKMFDPTTLQPNSVNLIVASRRSGKSTFVESLIHTYRQKNKVDI